MNPVKIENGNYGNYGIVSGLNLHPTNFLSWCACINRLDQRGAGTRSRSSRSSRRAAPLGGKTRRAFHERSDNPSRARERSQVRSSYSPGSVREGLIELPPSSLCTTRRAQRPRTTALGRNQPRFLTHTPTDFPSRESRFSVTGRWPRSHRSRSTVHRPNDTLSDRPIRGGGRTKIPRTPITTTPPNLRAGAV